MCMRADWASLRASGPMGCGVPSPAPRRPPGRPLPPNGRGGNGGRGEEWRSVGELPPLLNGCYKNAGVALTEARPAGLTAGWPLPPPVRTTQRRSACSGSNSNPAAEDRPHMCICAGWFGLDVECCDKIAIAVALSPWVWAL